ncbi:MAG: hypothetical protein Q8L27_02285 [archaeon]|nr:hypothetical protein [archaeon]
MSLTEIVFVGKPKFIPIGVRKNELENSNRIEGLIEEAMPKKAQHYAYLQQTKEKGKWGYRIQYFGEKTS